MLPPRSGEPVFRVTNDGSIIVGLNGTGKITAAIIDPYLVENTGTIEPTLTFRNATTGGADDFIFDIAGGEIARLQENGNLGLGVTNPSSKLQVAGDILPEANSTRNLGSNSLSFNNVFGTNVYAANIYTTGNVSGFWERTDGALYPNIQSVDLLLGSTATSTAKFGFTNVLTGTPTASVSAGLAGATILTADGTLRTTANQTLALGGGNTGNILLDELTTIGSLSNGLTITTDGILSDSNT